ncbi:MAG TPA: hypothetical protein VF250_09775 [Conexibacter sp.]
MVHVRSTTARVPPTTTRLATATAGDLRAASACATVAHDRIAVALHECDTRLGRIPHDQLIELSAHAVALEAAAGRVLRHVDPAVAEKVPNVAQLSRDRTVSMN